MKHLCRITGQLCGHLFKSPSWLRASPESERSAFIADSSSVPIRDIEALVELHTEDCEVGHVSVSRSFRGHEGMREFWTSYHSTFDEMRSEFRNVFVTEEGAALERTTEGTSNVDAVSYSGVSILEIEGRKVHRFMANFDTRQLAPQVVD